MQFINHDVFAELYKYLNNTDALALISTCQHLRKFFPFYLRDNYVYQYKIKIMEIIKDDRYINRFRQFMQNVTHLVCHDLEFCQQMPNLRGLVITYLYQNGYESSAIPDTVSHLEIHCECEFLTIPETVESLICRGVYNNFNLPDSIRYLRWETPTLPRQLPKNLHKFIYDCNETEKYFIEFPELPDGLEELEINSSAICDIKFPSTLTRLTLDARLYQKSVNDNPPELPNGLKYLCLYEYTARLRIPPTVEELHCVAVNSCHVDAYIRDLPTGLRTLYIYRGYELKQQVPGVKIIYLDS